MNMFIPRATIIEYLYLKFTDYTETQSEFVVNSIFEPDDRKKMSINMDSGLWQDFKSGEKGNFVTLVSFMERISMRAASLFISRKLLHSPELLFFKGAVEKKGVDRSIKTASLNHYKESFIQVYGSPPRYTKHFPEKLAYNFIKERGLEKFKFYVAIDGNFVNRIIIPYEDESGMFFFQGRALFESKVKYKNPAKEESHLKASTVLLPFSKKADYVFVTEGPIDALSLKAHGVNATCANGSIISYDQARMLKGRTVVMSFDNDDAGRKGTKTSLKILSNVGVKDVWFCNPPKEYKDWNAMHVAEPSKVRDYVMGSIQKSFMLYKITSELL